MGKTQKKRTARRHNPMRVPDSHIPKGLESAASSSQKEKVEAVLPIIQKLGSDDVAERTWACAAVSNLIQNDPATRRLLQGKNVVGALIARLSDSSEEVAAEATGALRNLCIDGGFEICAEMFNKGIIGPLKEFIPKLSGTLQNVLDNPKSAPEKVQELVYEFAENLITILWCLSETSNKALNAINSISLISFLMAFIIHRSKLPRQVVHAAAQCLYVLSEDNPPAIQNIRSESEYVASLVATSTTQQGPNDDEWDIGIRVLCCGTLRNISPLPAALNASSIDIDRSIALPLITPLLSYSLEEAVEEVQKTLVEPPAPLPNPSLKFAKLPKSDHKSPAELTLERVERRLRVLQLSLEILTGVCAQIPEPEPVEDNMVEEDEGVDMDEEKMEDDEEIIQNGVDDSTMDADADELPNLPEADSDNITLLRTLAPLLLTLSTPTSMSFPTSTATPEPKPEHLPTTSALVAVHISALECLSNLLLSFPTSDSGPVNTDPSVLELAVTAWPRAWAALNTFLTTSSNADRRIEVSIAALGVLWGLARLARGVLVPTQEHIQTLIQIADSPQADDQVQVKCVGILGSLAQNVNEVEMNKAIAQYLLSYIHPTPRAAEPTLHALSLLIDIYADEANAYDINFRNMKGTDVLASSVTPLRKLVRSIDRRKEGGLELRRWAEEVEGNVRGFVTYRRKLRI